jgi:prepilin-type N-terminal cleavage/methylation domain-containing protein
MSVEVSAHVRDARCGLLEMRRFSRSLRINGRSEAFTLLEILLAVALLGIMSAALVSIAPRLADARPQTPSEIFWEAARAARRSALTSDSEVRLSYDPKEREFVLEGGEGGKKFRVPETRDLTIDFLQAR